MERFLRAQRSTYPIALSEIKNGKKETHWMWYTFPQIKGLGFSQMSKVYEIKDQAEAEAFLHHPVLGPRLHAISRELLKLKETNPTIIFGTPDDMKLRSCMTLFASVATGDLIFEQVLNKFYKGTKDSRTLDLLKIG